MLESSLRVLVSEKTLIAVQQLVVERNKSSLAMRHSTSSVVREAIERLLSEQELQRVAVKKEAHRGR